MGNAKYSRVESLKRLALDSVLSDGNDIDLTFTDIRNEPVVSSENEL